MKILLSMVKNFYSAISNGYDELYKEEQLKKLNLIKENIKIKQDSLLLDIGSGTGISSSFFNCKTIALDNNLDMLKKYSGSKICANAENLPFSSNTFDIIISVTAIQNFNNIEISIKEIKRISKENSQIIITCLKKSKRIEEVRKTISNYFIFDEISQEKDIIFLVKHAK